MTIDKRFQVSGFGCQETCTLNPLVNLPGMTNVGIASLSRFKIGRIHYSMFDVGRWMFDVHYSIFDTRFFTVYTSIKLVAP